MTNLVEFIEIKNIIEHLEFIQHKLNKLNCQENLHLNKSNNNCKLFLQNMKNAYNAGYKNDEITKNIKSSIVEFKELKIDKDSHKVFIKDKEIKLTLLEYNLLTTLLERSPRIQTRDALLNDVWGIHIAINTRAIDTQVKRLRSKLLNYAEYIETIRSIGYRWKKD